MDRLSPFAQSYLSGCLIFLCIMLAFCVLRAITGKGITNRILGVSMICTLIVIMTCVFAAYMGESYLLDVAILFALLGILIIEILTRVILGKTEKSEGKPDDN
ncbi:MAG: hypothetical protein GX684_00320 [Ruminococcaceae bacterium]|nr:hypothetical protein [Oscillospiraceae bacterium]